MESISIETSTILGDAESMDAVISEVRKGLMSKRKSLAPWLFYDDAGSALFEEITTLPEYYVSRLERKILHSSDPGDRRRYSGALQPPWQARGHRLESAYRDGWPSMFAMPW